MLDTCPVRKLWGGEIPAGYSRPVGAPISDVDVTPFYSGNSVPVSTEQKPSLLLLSWGFYCYRMFYWKCLSLCSFCSFCKVGWISWWDDYRSDKGRLRCCLLYCGWEIGTCQLLVSVGEHQCWRAPWQPQMLESTSMQEYWHGKCFPAKLLLYCWLQNQILQPTAHMQCYRCKPGISTGLPLALSVLLPLELFLEDLKPWVSEYSGFLMALHDKTFQNE